MITPHTDTRYEASRELDMAGRFVPTADLTQDDVDNFHVSDIQLQLPAAAYFASYRSALVRYSQTEGDFIRNVPSIRYRLRQR